VSDIFQEDFRHQHRHLIKLDSVCWARALFGDSEIFVLRETVPRRLTPFPVRIKVIFMPSRKMLNIQTTFLDAQNHRGKNFTYSWKKYFTKFIFKLLSSLDSASLPITLLSWSVIFQRKIYFSGFHFFYQV